LLAFDELIAMNQRVSGLLKSEEERSPWELFDKASAEEGRISWNCLDISNFLAGRFLSVVTNLLCGANVEDGEDGWGSTLRAGQSTPGTVVRTAKLDVDDKLGFVFE
jgi:hypothetical protein